jgi:4-amino-4-deoxy-L-arabinose transferase-like glycosyltransferase
MITGKLPSGKTATEAGNGLAVSTRPSRVATAWALAGLLVIGGLLRLGAVLTVGDVPVPHGDERYYTRAAQTMAAGNSYPGAMHPPGYPSFLAVVFGLFGDSLTAARLAQIPISLMCIALVFDLARRGFGYWPAFVSGAVCALHPTLVSYTHFLWSETLFSALLLLSFWLLMQFDESKREPWLIAAGTVLGLAALTREMIVYFIPFTVLWLWLGDRAAVRTQLRRVVLLLCPVVLVILPWSVRNFRVFHRFVLISAQGWTVTAIGNLLPRDGSPLARDPASRELQQRLLHIEDEIQRETVARAIALDLIAREQPWWIFKKLWRDTYLLFTPDSQLSRFLREGWFRPEMQPWAQKLRSVELGFYVVQMLLGIAALWLVPAGRMKWLAVAWIVFSLAVFVVAVADHRYRVPLLPLFALYAGPLLFGKFVRNHNVIWRLVGAVVCVAIFAVVVTAFAHTGN